MYKYKIALAYAVRNSYKQTVDHSYVHTYTHIKTDSKQVRQTDRHTAANNKCRRTEIIICVGQCSALTRTDHAQMVLAALVCVCNTTLLYIGMRFRLRLDNGIHVFFFDSKFAEIKCDTDIGVK